MHALFLVAWAVAGEQKRAGCASVTFVFIAGADLARKCCRWSPARPCPLLVLLVWEGVSPLHLVLCQGRLHTALVSLLAPDVTVPVDSHSVFPSPLGRCSYSTPSSSTTRPRSCPHWWVQRQLWHRVTFRQTALVPRHVFGDSRDAILSAQCGETSKGSHSPGHFRSRLANVSCFSAFFFASRLRRLARASPLELERLAFT